MKKRKFMLAYRLDGGIGLGIGHLRKGLNLARALSKQPQRIETIFFIKRDSEGMVYLRDHAQIVKRIPENASWKEECDLMARSRPDLVVLDVLDTDRRYVERIKKQGVKVLSMEDRGTGARLADVVINAISEGVASKVLRHKRQTIFRGGNYRIFHEAYDSIRKNPGKKRSIAVSFGGTDVWGITRKTVQALLPLALDYKIVVVMGPSFPHESEDYRALKHLAGSGRIELVENAEHLANVFSSSLVAITGGGGTLYEVSRLGVPTLAIACVPDQAKNIRPFERKGAVIYLGAVDEVPEIEILEMTKSLLRDEKKRRRMAANARRLSDGKGRERVVKIIGELIRSNGGRT